MHLSKTILITGATGNIGFEVIRSLTKMDTPHVIIAAVSNPVKAKNVLQDFNVSEFRKLDFMDTSTFENALNGIDIVFLLRPPHLADVKRHFMPFIQKMKEKGISKIVFLSVQGAETKKWVPHSRIEKLIREEHFDYVFLRPGYFMQNLTSALSHEIKTKNKIFIPSGNLRFNWVDANDVGRVGAFILNDFEKYSNQFYELTGTEYAGFKEVAALLSDVTGRLIRYESPNLIKFYLFKRRLGLSRSLIFLMLMLHYFPRFGKNAPRLTSAVAEITGRQPTILRDFVWREKDNL